MFKYALVLFTIFTVSVSLYAKGPYTGIERPVPIAPTPATTQSTSTKKAATSTDDFEAQLSQQVAVAMDAIIRMGEDLGDVTGVSPVKNIQIRHALSQLQVRQTLLANFSGTSSLQSEKVRTKLLQIMQQETISEIDLQALQLLVQAEKAKTLSSQG